MAGISVKHLDKHYGQVQALSGVSLDIMEGELFFLLGASGCGKTTLLRCIAGLEEPTGGAIHFGERDVTQVPAFKREAAMVFQSYALWPHMTVGQNVAFGLEERKVPKSEIKQRVDEALKMVHLDGYAEREVDQMSGGQQQRVALARALVVKPQCLLLDEPLSNLDAQLRLEMRSEIRRIVKENGLTAVYVTHDQEEALAMADRMAVLDKGEICQLGTPEEIYRTPRSAHVASFIGETNLIGGTVSHTEDNSMTVETPLGTIVGIRSDEAWVPQLGSPAKVSIRPEALSFGSTGLLNLKAVIETRVYLGSEARYVVTMADGSTIQLSEHNPGMQTASEGDEVTIMASQENVLILEN